MIDKINMVAVMLFFLSCSRDFEKKDIYVDRLVYVKSDSTLFTGTLKVSGGASYYYVNFCAGMPCGQWAENENSGGVVFKGSYLDKNTLSEATQKLIGANTFLIDHWQESELPHIQHPPHLTIIILKDEAFFQWGKSHYEDQFNQLAEAVLNDTHGLKYDYLKITFVNAVFDWTKDYSKEYRLEYGELLEIK